MLATLDRRPAAGAHAAFGLLRAWLHSRFFAADRFAARSCVTRAIAGQQTLRLPAARGQRIECLEGCVWITIDHDRRDLVVAAGQAFTADRHERVLVHALQPSCVRLVSPAR